MMRKKIVLLLCAYCVYAGIYIYQTSFVIGGERYFCLFDDGMVSMRYARNLAQGYGLVWNPGGERVEGYTNLLWVLYLAILHLLPIAQAKISLLVQLSSAILLVVNLIVVGKITALLSRHSDFAVLTALLLTAFYLPLNHWSLQGMEVGLLTLTMSASVWLALQGLQQQRVFAALYLLLGAATLVRTDMLVPCLALVSFLAFTDRPNRRRHALLGLTTLLVFLLGQTAFRWFYYGEILPNTYGLKMTGYPTPLRVGRGFLMFVDFVIHLNVLFLLPFIVVLQRRDRRFTLLLWLFLAQCAYSIYVGGDAWEWWGGSNRYLSIAMPLFFILCACLLDSARELLGQRSPREPAPIPVRLMMAASVLACLINANAGRGDSESLREWLLLSRPLYARENQVMVERAQAVRAATRPEATVAVLWAGIPPYFMHRNAIDLLGKNDKIIAHGPMQLPSKNTGLAPFLFFHPGHLKWNYRYAIGQLQPDVVMQLDERLPQARAFLDASYRESRVSGHTFYLRRNSPRILWNRVDAFDKSLR